MHDLKLVKFDPQTCTPFSKVVNLQIEALCLKKNFWWESWEPIDSRAEKKVSQRKPHDGDELLRDHAVLSKRDNNGTDSLGGKSIPQESQILRDIPAIAYKNLK